MSDRAQRELDIARAYRALFLNDDGSHKPDADVVLRDLEHQCGWMPKALPVIDGGAVDPLRLAADSERRRVFAHIKGRLFGDLTNIKRAIETDRGDQT